MEIRLCWLLLATFFSFSLGATETRENIGELKIHDLVLRPYFLVKEPQQGKFGLGESSFALRWELDEEFRAVIRVGSRLLTNPTARYTPTVNDDLQLVEAFAEYQGVYGRLRMGRIPTEFGLEGAMWERDLVFPRSLLFSNRVVELRDIGISYFVGHNDFYTEFIAHNGESDSDKDGRMWYTAKWGYQVNSLNVGVAAETGTTKPSSTATSGDVLADVDVNKEALWRLGGLYLDVSSSPWRLQFEAYGGEREQEKKIRRFASGHVDLGRKWSSRFSTHIRYDQFEPDMRINGDGQRAVSLALQLTSGKGTSNLFLIGTKVLEESHQIANDELRLVWSLSPSGIVAFDRRSSDRL